jgi:hypothetical protein
MIQLTNQMNPGTRMTIGAGIETTCGAWLESERQRLLARGRPAEIRQHGYRVALWIEGVCTCYREPWGCWLHGMNKNDEDE